MMADFTFWIIAALLLLLSLAFVLLPLIKSQRNRAQVSREEINKAIYLGKVEDLQADLEKGLLDKDEYDYALADLQQTLLQDAADETQQPAASGNNVFITLAVALILPVLAFALYEHISTGQFTNDVSQQQAASARVQSLENSIAALEQKLKDKPDNVGGWKVLGQSYFVMRRYDDAKQAYIKALDLVNQSDPELLVLTAEASAFSNNELFSDYEQSLLQKALAINPKHQRGLWYAGYAAYTSSNYVAAVEHWQVLLTLVPSDQPEVKTSLLNFLGDARSKAGLPALEEATSDSVVAANNERNIQVSVQLNATVNDLANSTDTLFIYARPAQGPKMPLSLARMTVASLPVTVTLTEDMAMMPNMTMGSFNKVEVLARISKSGEAIAQVGDLTSAGVMVDFTQNNSAIVSLDINAVTK